MEKRRTFFDPAKMPIVYHPGEMLEEKLQEMRMGVKEFATRVSKPEKTIIAVLKGKSSITPDMAVAFELVTKIPATMWLRNQQRYDEYLAREKKQRTLKEGASWAEKFPFEEIANLGWFAGIGSGSVDSENRVGTLCAFFAVSSPTGWEDFYLNQKLRVAFSISLAEACDPYALSAWLRRGEIQAEEIRVNVRNTPKLLRSALEEISQLRKAQATECEEKLTGLLRRVGIKLMFTDTLSSAPVKGCARYIGGIPCVQLAKGLNLDHDLWYTLYHELGHILLHGKKDIFIENADYGNKDIEKEKEADDFATLWMNK